MEIPHRERLSGTIPSFLIFRDRRKSRKGIRPLFSFYFLLLLKTNIYRVFKRGVSPSFFISSPSPFKERDIKGELKRGEASLLLFFPLSFLRRGGQRG